MRRWLAIVTSILIGCATSAAAQGRETAASAFAGVQQLKFSPGGKYVFAADEFRTVTIVETACLRVSGGACPAIKAWTKRYFPVNNVYFSKDDRFIYLAEMGITAQKTPDGILTIREHEVARLLRGDRAPRRSFSIQLSNDLKHSVDIEMDVSRWSTAAANAYFAKVTPTLEHAVSSDSRRPDNVSNVFGRVAGERSLVLRRDDQDYFVYCRANGAPERLLWKNGSAFESRRANLAVRFDGKDPIVQTQGSVLRLSNCALHDETAGLPRALLIEGDDPSGYYGFATAQGVRPRHVTRPLAARLSRAFKAVADQHVMGIAVSNRHDLALISHGPFFRREQRPRANGTTLDIMVAGYQHDFYFAGRKVALVPPGKLIATHRIDTVDGGRLFVESYSRPENRKHVVFLYGGPGLYENFEKYAWPDLVEILDSGANIDVVHYGGSGYTFGLKDHLYRGGTASLARDAQALEDYVFSRYEPGNFVALRLRSFGGAFYRFLSPKLLHRFNNIVLDAPSGSFAGYPGELSPLAYKFNQMNLGEDTATEARKYYTSLRSCQLIVKTVIVVGRKDDRVDPDFAYRFCKNSDKLEMIYHDGDHLEESPSADPARMEIYRRMAEKLVQE